MCSLFCLFLFLLFLACWLILFVLADADGIVSVKDVKVPCVQKQWQIIFFQKGVVQVQSHQFQYLDGFAWLPCLQRFFLAALYVSLLCPFYIHPSLHPFKSNYSTMSQQPNPIVRHQERTLHDIRLHT